MENFDKSEGECRESGLECSHKEILFMVISKIIFWTRISTTFFNTNYHELTINWLSVFSLILFFFNSLLSYIISFILFARHKLQWSAWRSLARGGSIFLQNLFFPFNLFFILFARAKRTKQEKNVGVKKWLKFISPELKQPNSQVSLSF